MTTEAFALAMIVKLYYDIRAGKHYKMKLYFDEHSFR
eukprot:COSAG03_NODE_983_length_5114_cov_18.281555_4_plen_37_part_00